MGLTFQNKSAETSSTNLGSELFCCCSVWCFFNDATLRLRVQDSFFLPFPLFHSV